MTLTTTETKLAPVIAFDIDGTLCYFESRIDNYNKQIETNPECTCLYHSGGLYVFKPYVKFLINYLIHMGCRIVFFSAGICFLILLSLYVFSHFTLLSSICKGSKERNENLVSKLLSAFYSDTRKQKLLAAGQFKIFSLSDCHIIRPRCPYNNLPILFQKNLSVILEGNETIDDIILIDDRFDIVANNQEIMIHMGLFDSSRQMNSCFFPIHTHFFKNGTYFLLGLFKTYFDTPCYNHLPVREAMKQILMTSNVDSVVKANEKIAGQMVSTGLHYVRLYTPEAVFYGSKHIHMRFFTNEQIISLNHSQDQIKLLKAKAAILDPTKHLNITKWAAMYIFNLNYLEKLQFEIYI